MRKLLGIFLLLLVFVAPVRAAIYQNYFTTNAAPTTGGLATNIFVGKSGVVTVTTNVAGSIYTVNLPVSTIRTYTTNNVVITLSPKGINNSLSTVTNDGAMFGPDTAGTTTSGLQEAINSIPVIASAGPVVDGAELKLSSGYFYFTNAIMWSNQFPRGLTIRGENMLNTKLVYAGPTNVVQTILICGTTVAATRAGSLNLPVHLTMVDLGFSSITNSTNILVKVRNYSQFSGERLNFTSWQVMTNQVDGASLSTDTASVGGVTRASQVGIVLTNGPDHGTFISDCYFMGLATGIDCSGDHVVAHGLKFAHIGGIGSMINEWPVTTRYSLGACIIREGGLDSLWSYMHMYSAKAGYVMLGEAFETPILDHAEFENVANPVGTLIDNERAPVLFNPVAYNDSWVNANLFPLQVSNSPNYGFVSAYHTNGIVFGVDGSDVRQGSSFLVYKGGAQQLGVYNSATLIAGGLKVSGSQTNSSIATKILGTDSNGKFKGATLSGATWDGTTFTVTGGGGGSATNTFFVTNSASSTGAWTNTYGDSWERRSGGVYNALVVGTNPALHTVITDDVSEFANGTWVDTSSSGFFFGKVSPSGIGGVAGDLSFGRGFGTTLDTTGDVTVGGNVPVTGIIIGNGRSITNNPVVALYSATNTWGSQTFDFNVAEATTNMAAAITITGLVNTGVGKTNYDHIVRYILASGSDRTFTPSAGTFVNGVAGAPAFVCTNGQLTTINVVYQGGNFTNLTHVP